MPFRNAADTIVAAARSVLSESETTLIAVDDGSEDGGSDVLQRACPQAKVLRTDPRGIVAALQEGLAAATTRWIARMDADDVSLPGRIEKARSMLASDPHLAAVGTQARSTGSPAPGLDRYLAWQNSLLSAEQHRHARFIEAPLCHPTVVMRRSALTALGGYHDAPWPEDFDLWLRLASAGWGLAKVPEVLFEWRHRDGRLTFTDPRYSPEAFRQAKAHYLVPILAQRPFAIWGAGTTGRRLARALEGRGLRPRCFIDIDPRKLGREARGAPILPFESLPPGMFIIVAVGAPGARQLIEAALVDSGRDADTHYLFAA